MATLSMNSPSKIVELESVRGLAALLVVFYHIPKWNPTIGARLINNGYLMVELFFVLSGFVIFSAYSKKIASAPDLIKFQFLRFGRLYPVHLLFLVIYLLFELAKYIAAYKFGVSIPNNKPFTENSQIAFLEQAFLIQAIGETGNAMTFNGPAWSISVEFYTYLVFGLGVLYFKQSKNRFFLLMAVISTVMLWSETTFGFHNLLRCFAGFFIGCLTAAISGRAGDRRLPSFTPLLVFLSIIIFLQLKTYNHYDLLIYLLSATLIASIAHSDAGILSRILNVRPFVYLGAISYSVYMSHSTVIWVANQFLRVVMKRPEAITTYGISTPQLSPAEALVCWIVVMLVVIGVSIFVYKFVEQPMRERSRRFAFQLAY